MTSKIKNISSISKRTTRISRDNQETIITESTMQHTLQAQSLYKSRSSTPEELGNGTMELQPLKKSFPSSYGSPTMDIGIDLDGIISMSTDDMGNKVYQSPKQSAQLPVLLNEDGRPFNFGVVANKIYRSSMPSSKEEIQHLESLGLKTVLSLVQKDLSPEFQQFLHRNSIRHHVVDMPGTKKDTIPEAFMASIMKIVLDKRNYPILIHCNHGKHRTGCVVAVLRHVVGWRLDHIVEEYRGFAHPKIRECDIEYISKYQASSLRGLFTTKENNKRRAAIQSEKWQRMLLVTIFIVALWLFTLMYL